MGHGKVSCMWDVLDGQRSPVHRLNNYCHHDLPSIQYVHLMSWICRLRLFPKYSFSLRLRKAVYMYLSVL